MQQNQRTNQKVLPVQTKRNHKLFLLVLLLAFYLRIQGLGNGLSIGLNTGEASAVIKSLLLLSKSFFKGIFFLAGDYETSLVYGLFNSLIALAGSLTHGFLSLTGFLETEPQILFSSLRGLSVLFGTGSVAVLYLIGKRFGQNAGLFASLFLAVSLLHIMVSQQAGSFSAMVFFFLLSNLYLLKAFEGEESKIKTSTFLAGCSAVMHFTGIVSFIPVMIALKLLNKCKEYKKTFLGIVAVVVLFNLPKVLDLFSLYKYWLPDSSDKAGSGILYSFSFLVIAVGPVVYFSSLFFFKFLQNTNRSLLKILISLPLFCIGLFALIHCSQSKYALLIVPYICLLSGIFFETIKEKWTSDEMKFTFYFLVILAVWIPLKYSLRYNKITALPDTREIATEWVKENSGRDYKVTFDDNSIKLKWFESYDSNLLSALGINSDKLTDKKRYKIDKNLLKKKDWFKILRKKADYVVINSIDYEKALRDSGDPLQKKYYKKMMKLEPKIVFSPYLKDLDQHTNRLLTEELYLPFLTLWQRERAGPVIKVYKI